MTTTRWAEPSGWTVDVITLSDTPNPSRPGDPPRHTGPRPYLKVTHLGTNYGYCAGPAELAALADREAWDRTRLVDQPTHVIVDVRDGRVTSHNGDGEPFGRADAIGHASAANAKMGKGAEHAHRVYALIEISTPRGGEN